MKTDLALFILICLGAIAVATHYLGYSFQEVCCFVSCCTATYLVGTIFRNVFTGKHKG